MAEQEPNLIQIDTIGYGGEFNLPIWLIKISDHPNRVEAEPALLFIGQVHAEEVVGVEIVLELMKLLIDNCNENPYRRRLEGLELYFIPTLNPDGFDLVHRDLDVTFRKNCRDNVGDGELRFRRGLGRDSSGVDLNRNFGLHWDRGDSLFFDNGLDDAYNYYRGPAPFSEPETRSLRDLMLGRRFEYAISYHGSRSGRNSELVIGPWSWEGKRPPGDGAIFSLATALALRIPRQEVADTYIPVRATMRVGQEQDWAYQTAGCMMYMIEVGADIQPDSAMLEQLISDNIWSATYLMDLALGDSLPDNQGLLTVTAHDSSSGEPLPAIVWLGPEPSLLLAPLTCDSTNGRFDRLVTTGEYELHVEYPGFRPFVINRFEIPIGGVVTADVNLSPLPIYSTIFSVIDDSTEEFIPARISILTEFGETDCDLHPDQGLHLQFTEGIHRILFRADGYVPYFLNKVVDGISNDTIRLVRGTNAFEENFNHEQDWQQGGMEGRWSVTNFAGRTCLTESDTGDYPQDAGTWLMLETGVYLTPNHSAVIELIHRPYFEPGEDFGRLQAFDVPNGAWKTLISFSCFPPDDWDTTYIDLAGLGLDSEQLRLRFFIDSDASVEEDGWLIDKLTLFFANSTQSVQDEENLLPYKMSIAAYPSPANGTVTLLLDIPTQMEGDLILYDTLGREVKRHPQRIFVVGKTSSPIDVSDLSSGSYIAEFCGQGRFAGQVTTTSFLLLK